MTPLLYAKKDSLDNYKLGLTTGYSYAKIHFIQVGAIWGRDYGDIYSSSKGFGVGSDIGLINDKLTIGLKSFYEYNFFTIIGFRLNAINYFRGQNIDFRLMPQLGFSFFGYINFMYGYSLPTLGNELSEINRHSFSLTFNIIQFKKKRII